MNTRASGERWLADTSKSPQRSAPSPPMTTPDTNVGREQHVETLRILVDNEKAVRGVMEDEELAAVEYAISVLGTPTSTNPGDDFFKQEFRALARAVTELGVVLHFRDDGGFARAELPTSDAQGDGYTEIPKGAIVQVPHAPGTVIGWRMEDGVRVYDVQPESVYLDPQRFVKLDDYLALRAALSKPEDGRAWRAEVISAEAAFSALIEAAKKTRADLRCVLSLMNGDDEFINEQTADLDAALARCQKEK